VRALARASVDSHGRCSGGTVTVGGLQQHHVSTEHMLQHGFFSIKKKKKKKH